MAKLTLTDITSGYALTTTLNANNALIEAALENTLSRNGAAPNTMSANLDMNSNRVTNVANATNAQDAVTLAQVEALTGQQVVGFLTEIVQDTTPELGGDLETGGYDIIHESTDQIIFATAGTNGTLYHNGTDMLLQSGDGDLQITAASELDLNASQVHLTGNVALADNKAIEFGQGSGTGTTDFDVRIFFNATNDELVFASGSAAGDKGIFIDESITQLSLYRQTPINWEGGDFDGPIRGCILERYQVGSQTASISSGVLTISMLADNAAEVTLTENVSSVVISNVPDDAYTEVIIKFIQDGTGSRTVTGWPAGVKWATGSAPTITTTATTGTDIVVLKTWDGGTTWYGDYSQDYS